MKLDIGCGKNKKKGFIGIDISKNSNAEIIASAMNLPIKDSTIEEINCSHLVEHLCPQEAQKLFDEIFRVIKGGKANLKIDREWTQNRLLSKDPTHKCRFNMREIENMVTNFRVKEVKRKIYRFGYEFRNNI